MQSAKTTVSQQVVEYLKRNIADKAWGIGEKIPSENTLTRELGVSRASVRLAIQQFIALGILDSVHGKGTFIMDDNMEAFDNNLSLSNIAQNECRDAAKVLEFRLILEPQTCYVAVERMGEGTLERLREHLHAQVASIGDSEAFIRHDMQFHLEICRASENLLLYKALREVFEQTKQNHKRINTIFGYKDGVYYHSLLFKAFEGRNRKEARRLMTEHLQQALEQLDKR